MHRFIYHIYIGYIWNVGDTVVSSVINISERANRILNIIKAKYGLHTKSEAINQMADEYEHEVLEPELRPEYVEKLGKIEKEKSVKVKDFNERYGI